MSTIIPLWLKRLHPWIDKTEAPNGYIAIAKGTPDGKNICNHCDYRPECIKNAKNICADYAREDNMSVMFKRIENVQNG